MKLEVVGPKGSDCRVRVKRLVLTASEPVDEKHLLLIAKESNNLPFWTALMWAYQNGRISTRLDSQIKVLISTIEKDVRRCLNEGEGDE